MMMILMLMKGEDSRNEIPKCNNDDVAIAIYPCNVTKLE